MTESSGVSLADHWAALASAALLGTDRHPVPEPPRGALAELLVERPPQDNAQSVLDQVAALTALQRGGVRPNPPVPRLLACAADPRPPCPPAAVARLELLLAQWPHLVDEWLARLGAGGWAMPEEVAVVLLARFRADPTRRAVVAGLAGELAVWLAELFPEELAPRRGPAPSPAEAELLPLPDDLVALTMLPPAEVASAMTQALAAGRFTNRHRPLLVRLVSSLSVAHLAPLGEALSRGATNPDTMGLALTLADLAHTRLDLVRELMP